MTANISILECDGYELVWFLVKKGFVRKGL